MRRNNPRYNAWLKHRLKHLEKRKRKKKGRRSGQTHYSYKSKENKQQSQQESYVVSAPRNFSIKDNALEMSDFFDKVVSFTNKRQKSAYILFDLSKVENITADAIIYLLAVIKDLQKLGLAHHRFIGNLPFNQKARECFIQSGFLDYMESKIPKDYTNSQCVRIMSNDKYNQLSTKAICDFTTNYCNSTKQSTRFLYVLINEMMLNTYQHAYTTADSNKLNKWYLFAQKDANVLKYTFLDIGLGIPKTVRKKWTERLWSTESSIIASALDGEFRTTTKKEYRGKGLPKIKECVKEHKLNNFTIISNKGFCKLKDNNGELAIEENELQKPIFGTIYYWEIQL